MKLILPQEIDRKLKFYVDEADGEISGLGRISISDDDDDKKLLRVEEIIILKQICTTSSTDLDEEAIAKHTFNLHKEKANLKEWIFWWHSHADMGVFWSTTDTDTMESHLGQQPFLVSLVVNKKGELLARVDVFPKDISPLGIKFSFKEDKIPVEIEIDEKEEERLDESLEDLRKERDEIREKFKKEIDSVKCKIEDIKDQYYDDTELQEAVEKEVIEKVSEPEKTPVTDNYGGYYHGGYYDYNQDRGRRDRNWWSKRGFGRQNQLTEGEIENQDFSDQVTFEQELEAIKDGIKTIDIEETNDEYEDENIATIFCPNCLKDVDIDVIEITNEPHPECPDCNIELSSEYLINELIKSGNNEFLKDMEDGDEIII